MFSYKKKTPTEPRRRDQRESKTILCCQKYFFNIYIYIYIYIYSSERGAHVRCMSARRQYNCFVKHTVSVCVKTFCKTKTESGAHLRSISASRRARREPSCSVSPSSRATFVAGSSCVCVCVCVCVWVFLSLSLSLCSVGWCVCVRLD